jgi:hypothetical protein
VEEDEGSSGDVEVEGVGPESVMREMDAGGVGQSVRIRLKEKSSVLHRKAATISFGFCIFSFRYCILATTKSILKPFASLLAGSWKSSLLA